MWLAVGGTGGSPVIFNPVGESYSRFDKFNQAATALAVVHSASLIFALPDKSPIRVALVTEWNFPQCYSQYAAADNIATATQSQHSICAQEVD